MIIEAIKQQPFSAFIVVMYACNVAFNVSRGNWGPALYWTAASLITVSATWLMGWRS